MSGRLPDQIDPIRLADEGARLQGEIDIAALTRLDALRSGDSPGAVNIDLWFERSLQGVRTLRGKLKVQFAATCQRCLEPVDVDIEARPFMEIRTEDAAESITDGAEVLVVDGPLRLGGFVEDELLLAMPMIPAHRPGACAAPADSPDQTRDSGPFAALRGGERAKKRNQGK